METTASLKVGAAHCVCSPTTGKALTLPLRPIGTRRPPLFGEDSAASHTGPAASRVLPLCGKPLPPATKAVQHQALSPVAGMTLPLTSKTTRHCELLHFGQNTFSAAHAGQATFRTCTPYHGEAATLSAEAITAYCDDKTAHRTRSHLMGVAALLSVILEVALWATTLFFCCQNHQGDAQGTPSPVVSRRRWRRPSCWLDDAPLSAPPRQSWRSPCFVGLMRVVVDSSST